MSLRTRLILFFAGLTALLGLAEWWLVAALTERLQEERRQDAIAVGEAIFSQLGLSTELPETSFLLSGRVDAPLEGAGVILGGREIEPAELLRRIEAGERIEGWEQLNAEERRHFTEMVRDLADAVERGELPTRALPGPGLGLPPDAVILDTEFPPPDWIGGPGVNESIMIQVFSPRVVDAAREPVAHPFPLPLPGEEPGLRLEAFRSRLLLGSGAILLLGMAVAAFGAHHISVPLRRLVRTAHQVEDGQLGATVEGGGSGEVGEVLRAFNSMSERLSELQDEAERLREQAHLTELGELARGLAHAMRNPLHVLRLSAQSLQEDQGDPTRRAELAASMEAQVARVDRTLRSLLALSSSGRGTLEAVPMDDLCRDVALELMQSAGGGPTVQVEAPEPPPTLRGVPAELRALVHVLVVNAAEASPPELPVLVRLAATDSGCRVEVLDCGPGVPPEHRERLFTPHFTTKEQGAGLGLYLAQRIATSRYRGALRLEERGGGGVRAVLELQAPSGGEQEHA